MCMSRESHYSVYVARTQVIFMLQYFSSVDSGTLLFTVAKIVANCLAYMNSCVNPILYAFLSDNFRKAFFRLMACCVRDGDGTGGFIALRKIEVEHTNVSVGRKISAPPPAAGKTNRQDDDVIQPTGVMTQQTNL